MENKGAAGVDGMEIKTTSKTVTIASQIPTMYIQHGFDTDPNDDQAAIPSSVSMQQEIGAMLDNTSVGGDGEVKGTLVPRLGRDRAHRA